MIRKSSLTAWVIICLFLFCGGCGQSQTIKLGYVAGLTGRLADLGTGGRNGALLAAEEINSAGGIKGRQLDLLVRDDQSDTNLSLQLDRELIDAGAVAIVGHVISATSLATIPLMNSRQVLMLSPTVRTAALTGIDDYFFSLITPIWPATEQQANYAFNQGIKTMAMVYDLNNRQYSEDWTGSFAKYYTNKSGEIVNTVTVSSTGKIDYADTSRKIIESGASGVLLVLGAVDTAMICQHLRKAGSNIVIFTSSWPVTAEFIKLAGKAASGIIMSSPFYDNDVTPSFTAFQKKFIDRFGNAPNYAAVYSYEAVKVIASSLEINADAKQLKQTLLQQKTFAGVTGPFSFDSFGDTIRGNYLLTVRNGRFEKIE